MKLKKLTLKNIRSYKTGEITFPSGSTLLSGDIGSGKTTILLSISFALFGLQPGQRGSSLLSNSSDNGKISLELEIQDKQVKIERSLRKSRNSVTQESCSITIDGEKKDLSITELKAKILTLLNYPMEFIKKTNILYNYTVYSPQEQMKQIILEDPESRLNVLRHVFGIDKYKKIRENLSIITSKLREKSRILQYEIRDLEETRITLLSQREFINLTSSKLSETQNELKEKLQFRELNQEELKKLESKLGEKQNFEKEIEKTNLILSYKMQESKKLENEISELSKKLQNLPEFSQDSLDRTIQEINNIKNLIEPLNKQIIEISANATSLETKQKEDLIKKERLFKIDICPTCLQDVSDTYKNNILNETEKQIVGAKKQLSILNAQKEKNALDLKNKKSLLTELEEKKYELELLKSKSQDSIFAREKCLQLKKQKENLQKDSELLEKHIDLLKNSVLEFSKYDNLHNLKEEELKKSFQKEKEKEISLAELNKEI